MDYKKAFYTMGNEWFSGKSGLKANWAKFLPANQIITPNQAIENVIEHANIDWTNPNLKICDPCCGSGRFLIYCLIKLLEAGHSEKYIIENMLYGTEVSSECIDFIERFWKFNRYKHNIKFSSILKDDWSYNNMYFDLIIMNPPFKEPKLPGVKRSGKNLDIRIWDKCFSLKPKQMYSIMSDTSSRSNAHKYTFREDIEKFEGVTIATAIVGYTPNTPKLVQPRQIKYLDVINWVKLHKITNPEKALKTFRNNKLRGFKGIVPKNYIAIPDRSTQWRVFKPGDTTYALNGKNLQNCIMFNFTGYDIIKIYNYLTSSTIKKLAEEHLSFKNPVNNRPIGHTLETGFWECIEIPDSYKI